MSRVIKIWLTPDEESEVSERDLALYLGISLDGLRVRLKTLGPDHYLTYFPGPIPSKCRRLSRIAGSQSRLNEATITDRLQVTGATAKDVVLKLITISQKNFVRSGCESSKSFLLNENGMLEWYLEAFPGIDTEAALEGMREWVAKAEATAAKHKRVERRRVNHKK